MSALSDLFEHIRKCPIGYADGHVIVHRSTTETDIVEWFKRLEALREQAESESR